MSITGIDPRAVPTAAQNEQHILADPEIAAYFTALADARVAALRRESQVVLYTTAQTHTDLAAAYGELQINRMRALVDLTNYTEIQLTVGCSTVGSAGTSMRLEYSLDQSVWSAFGASNAPDVPLSALGLLASSWVAIPAEARTTVYVRQVIGGGNATADPQTGRIAMRMR